MAKMFEKVKIRGGLKMKITKEWLKGKRACKEGFDWWEKHAEANVKKLALRLVNENHFDWANWMLTRIFDKTQNIKYAIFAAEQAIGIYEKDYPKDDRPRKAIEAAKDYLKKSNDYAANAADAAANAAAYAAAYAADAANAADAADAAKAAANAAAHAAYAAYAANAAAYAAYAAADAANAANAAANAAHAANAAEIKQEIIDYGLSLIEED
jgi:hypothetical protein